jgi:hypothetical protein
MQIQLRGKVKVRRAIGRKTWKLLGKLPLFVRGPIIRRLFSIDPDLPEGLIFKKAETQDEIEQAFRIAYDAYRERGLVSDTESRLRVTKYHALPTSTILIAKQGDEVIATVTIVADSAMRLPLEKLFDIREVRRQSARIAEISTLAIKKEYRSQRGRLLFPLCIFIVRICRQYLGVDSVVASVHPEMRDLYESVFQFKVLNGGEVKNYDFVQGAAAIGTWLDLENLSEVYKKVYGKKSFNRNLYHHLEHGPWPQFQYPEETEDECANYQFTPMLLEYFFRQKTSVMETLTPSERKVISNAYYHDEYRAVIEQQYEQEEIYQRKDARPKAAASPRTLRVLQTT